MKGVETLLSKLDEFKNLAKAKIVAKFSDEAAEAAKEAFANRLRVLGKNPQTFSNLALDPELWANASKVAGILVGKGYAKFSEFSVQIRKQLGNLSDEVVSKLYREQIISLDLSQGKQILASNGRLINQVVIKEAKEKVYDLVKNNKPIELENYINGKGGIRERYGNELAKELEAAKTKYVDNLYETNRRTIDSHDLLGGHIRDKHIGRSETWLRNRLNDADMIDEDFASSFYNESTANRALGKFVNQYQKDIDEWLKNSNSKVLKRVFDFGEKAGIGVERGKTGIKTSNSVFVMLTKDSSEKGWHFVTAFPDIR